MLRLKGYLYYEQGCGFVSFFWKEDITTALCHTGMFLIKGLRGAGQGEDFHVTSAGFLTIPTLTGSLAGDNIGQTSP